MSSRALDLALAGAKGVKVLPDLTSTTPNVGDVMTVQSITGGDVFTWFTPSAGGGGSYTLPTASATILGGVKVGANLAIDGTGVLSASAGASYTLPIASPTVLGGVKVGANLAIDGTGVLSATASGGGPVTATGAITPRTLSDHFADRVYARDFGAIFDGTSHPLSASFASLAAAQAVYPKATALTNEIDGIAVQAAIDFCAARSGSTHEYSFGGTVILPNGLGLMNTPLTINNSCVSLVADTVRRIGFRSNVVYAALSAPTKLRWTGPAVAAPNPAVYMLTIRPSDGGRAIAALTIQGILFDCNSTAGVAGVLLKSVRHSSIALGVQEPRGVIYSAGLTAGSQTVTVSSTTNIAVGQSLWCGQLPLGSYVKAIVNATTLTASMQATATAGSVNMCVAGEGMRMDVEDHISDSNDCIGNEVWFTADNEQAAAYVSGPLLILGGSGVLGTTAGHFGNTCVNNFREVKLITASNPMLIVNNTDHNTFDLVDMFVSGTAPTGLVLNGSLDPNNGGARYNHFNYVAGAPLAAVGTDTGGFTEASTMNQILHLDRSNGGVIASCGTGATITATADNQTTLMTPYHSNLGVVAYLPDNTIMGGNGRGAFAVDLQTLRNAATQVASGQYATVAGGAYNTANGNWAACGGGVLNISSGQAAWTSGYSNTASGNYSVATGQAAIADIYALRAHTGNQLLGARYWQEQTQVLMGLSAANTTPVRLTADGAAAGSANVMNLTTGTEALAMRVQLIASDGNNFYAWAQPMSLLRRSGTVANIVYVPGTPTILTNGTTAGIAITEAADTVNGGYSLTFTPPTGNAAIWKIAATVTATRCDG